MDPRHISRLQATLAVLGAIALQGTMLRAESAEAETRPVVLLLAPSAEMAQAETLESAASAHLSELGAEVRLVQQTEGPDGSAQQATAAREELERHGALSAFWWDAASSSLLILTPELGDSPAVKPIPDTGEGWPTRCEAMAAVLQSELAPLLAAATEDAAPMSDTGPAESITDVVKPVQPAADTDRESDGPVTEIAATAAYVPALMSTDGPLLHGANLGASVVVRRILELGLSLDLMQPAALDVPDAQVDLVQWPLRVAITVHLPLSRWDVGLRLGGVFDFWRLRGLDYAPEDPESAERHLSLGVSTAFVARFRVLEWLAPWIEFGTDLHLTQLRHVYQGETLITLAYYRPRACIGLAFFFGLE